MSEHGGGGFWSEYWAILTDPAHFAAELTMTLLDIIILSPILYYIWRQVRTHATSFLEARVQKEHTVLDEEHGFPPH